MCRLTLKSEQVSKKKYEGRGYREVDVEKFKPVWESEFAIES